MVILPTNKNSYIFEVDNSLFDTVKEFLNNLSKKEKKSFSYVDECGDIIVVENGKAYVVPTKDDILSIYSIKKEDFINEDEVKKILDV